MSNVEVHATKPIKITVCADGHVSILRNEKDRRLKAAICCYGVDSIEDALMLIQKVCILKACVHGGKVGTLVEPWAPNWPIGIDADYTHIQELSKMFSQADEAQNRRLS